MASLNSAPRCEHIKIDGTPCGSPALTDNRFCFFHDRFREQHVTLNQKPSEPAVMSLPVFEDAASIQVALRDVMRLLLTDQIDCKKAGLLLYALQTASSNLARMPKPVPPEEEDWSNVSHESLWEVLGITPEEVLRVDRERKAAEAGYRPRPNYKMNETQGEPVGDIKAVACERSAGVPAGAEASTSATHVGTGVPTCPVERSSTTRRRTHPWKKQILRVGESSWSRRGKLRLQQSARFPASAGALPSK